MIGLVVAMIAAQAATPQQDAGWFNRQQLAIASLKAADGWRPLQGGLMWRRVKGDGQGAHPAVTDVVRLHYAGTLVDGTEFDSSYARGEPAVFPLDRLIPAWQLAVPQMGVGDTIEIAAPSTLAYGPVGKGPIPGGATLLFRIELLGIGEGRRQGQRACVQVWVRQSGPTRQPLTLSAAPARVSSAR